MREDYWWSKKSGTDPINRKWSKENIGKRQNMTCIYKKCLTVSRYLSSEPESGLLGAGMHRPRSIDMYNMQISEMVSLCVCCSCQDQRKEAHFIEAEMHHGSMNGGTSDSQIVLILMRGFFFFLEQKYDNFSIIETANYFSNDLFIFVRRMSRAQGEIFSFKIFRLQKAVVFDSPTG